MLRTEHVNIRHLGFSKCYFVYCEMKCPFWLRRHLNSKLGKPFHLTLLYNAFFHLSFFLMDPNFLALATTLENLGARWLLAKKVNFVPCHLQIHGTAMGTKMAPSYANLFLGFFEANTLKNAPFQPHTWLRYIDYIFMIWTEGLDNLKIFDYLNNIHSTIKFTSSHSSSNMPFLDVNVSLTNDGNISTDLYTKSTDKHQHLLYSSCHPLHTKKAIPFSLALRLRRICSTDATFHTRTAQLATYLLKRGYNRNFVNKQLRRAADIPRQLTL